MFISRLFLLRLCSSVDIVEFIARLFSGVCSALPLSLLPLAIPATNHSVKNIEKCV